MRILHLPTSVGSNAWNLSRAERELGYESDVLVPKTKGEKKQTYFWGEKSDLTPLFSENKYKKLWQVMKFYKSIIDEYDVFHFNFGSTLLSYEHEFLDMIDLIYLSLKKKVIVVTYQGSDARQVAYCLEHYDTTFYRNFSKKEIEYVKQFDYLKARRIAKFGQYADLIYSINPDLLQVLPKKAKFRPYTKLDLAEWKPCYSDYNKKKLRITHACTMGTRKKIKGSDIIVNVINQLQNEGYPMELDFIENVPNAEAKKRYAASDIVIDQLYAGWYGGLAVECMALGKPVISYIREADLKYIPQEMVEDLPIICAGESTLYQVLKGMTEHRDRLPEIARKSRLYVEKWHNNIISAQKIITDYEQALALKSKDGLKSK